MHCTGFQPLRGDSPLFEAGFGPNHLRFYVLIGYPGYSVEEELHRITTLHGFGIEPYVMVYRDFGEQDQRDPVRMDIQHWNNGHAWRAVRDFKDYRRALADRHGKRPAQPSLSLLDAMEAAS